MPKYISAYEEGCSTEMVLLDVTDNIFMNMDRQRITLMICTDLLATFNIVDLDIMMVVLEVSYGVKGNALKWCDSYLRGCSARVKIKDTFSDEINVDFSVPQGSMIGPYFFNLYVSSLSHEIKDILVTLSGYADNHDARNSFFANSRTQDMCSNEHLELFLERAKEWMDMNQLKINMSKTAFIRFGNQRQLDKCTTNSLNYDSETIDQVDCVKNVGVLMDRMLSYSKHINKKCAIAYHNLMNIIQLRGNLSEQNVTQLILALVISLLDFSNSLLTGLPKKVYKVMERVQNISAKLIIKRDREDGSMNSLKELHWLPVEYCVKYKI